MHKKQKCKQVQKKCNGVVNVTNIYQGVVGKKSDLFTNISAVGLKKDQKAW